MDPEGFIGEKFEDDELWDIMTGGESSEPSSSPR
jgi:hypothetical protein